MAIIFPLCLPPCPGFQSLNLRMQNIVGVSQSIFTGQQQTYEFPGEWLEADITIPPIADRATAEAWICFLAALRGQSGTFLLGDPLGRNPMGIAFGSPLIPIVGSISAAGSKTLASSGWDASLPAVLRPGDYLEIGRNFLASPSDFANSIWTKSSCTITPNAATAPDGSMMADQLVTGVLAFNGVSQTPSPNPPILAQGQNFTLGVWLRAAAPINVTISLGRLDLTLAAGVFGSQVVSVGTDWVYYELSAPLDVAASSVSVGISNGETIGKTFFAWGASLDDGMSRHRLHKVLTETDSDASGNATFDIFPRLRETPDEAAPIIVEGARGTFRLATNDRQFTLDAAKIYGISFKAIEAF